MSYPAMADGVGLEPTFSCVTGSRPTHWATRQYGGPGGTRTPTTLGRNQVPYPLDYGSSQNLNHETLAAGEGLEPPSPGSKPDGLPLADPAVVVPLGPLEPVTGLEPATLCLQGSGSSLKLHRPKTWGDRRDLNPHSLSHNQRS